MLKAKTFDFPHNKLSALRTKQLALRLVTRQSGGEHRSSGELRCFTGQTFPEVSEAL